MIISFTETTPAAETPRLNLQPLAMDAKGTDRRLSYDELKNTPTPIGTPTWRPQSHASLVDHLRDACNVLGVTVKGEAHLTSRNDARYFGLFEVGLPTAHKEISSVLGLRNSHDKSFKAGVCAGDAPFVCSNLCFSNEITLGRKHTAGLNTLVVSNLMFEAVARLLDARSKQDERIARLKEISLSDRNAHDIAVRSMRNGACAPTQLANVVEQWHDPEHAEFKPRTAWSLQNAFSNVWRKTPHLTPHRSAALAYTFNDCLSNVG